MGKPREVFNPDNGDNRKRLHAAAVAGGKASAEKRRRIAQRNAEDAEVLKTLAERHRAEAQAHEESMTEGIPESDR
jgi:phage protein D